MEYNWDINKINKLKQIYTNLLKNNHLSKEDKITYINYLSNIKDIKKVLNHLSNPLSNIMNSINPYIFLLLFSQIQKDYQNIPQNIRQTILKSLSAFQNLNITYNNDTSLKYKISHSELIALSHDFFKWLHHKKYLELFEKYTNFHNHQIHFQKKPYFESTLGLTYLFFYPKYIPFFLINTTNTINDFLTLNHELAHGIIAKNENNNNLYLSELEGFFFEFLSLQFLKEKKIISAKYLDQVEYQNFIFIIENFMAFYLCALKTHLNEHNISSNKKTVAQYVSHHKFAHIININSFGEENPQTHAIYLYSFLTSLKLEQIFFYDRELAIHQLEAIKYSQIPVPNLDASYLRKKIKLIKK